MRGSRAKALRRVAEVETPGMASTAYGDKINRTKTGLMYPGTRRLVQNCTRSVYQKRKKQSLQRSAAGKPFALKMLRAYVKSRKAQHADQ